ncbi:MAG: cobyrinate a,c-diamide synthase [Rhizobiales bacterium]|nr:cobyrinate a,c-diamide synthase [Hyphomicrobiales bacterium]
MRRGLVVSAPASGAGKTVVAAGLLRALSSRGVAVRAAKSGPDYIDPAFHQAATGRESVNLDTWAMPPGLLDALAGGAGGDVVLIEGAMGLFDGALAEPGRTGAAAELAAHFDLPVLLVMDVSGQAQTAAALVRGLATHDPRVKVAGVILNRVASERHRRFVADAVTAAGFPVLGAIPRDAALALPARHLGLVQAGEHGDIEACIARIGDIVARHVDLDAVVAAAGPLMPRAGDWQAALPPPGSRIALARDEAFSFIYPHVLAGWRRANAEIVAFSPLAGEAPPADCDACWLPGGYPELHAGRLAAANRFHEALRAFAATRPVHGECGGHMVLGRWLEDADGVRHPMTGLLGHATSFARRKLTLGYREARLVADGAIGRKGAVVRGHEFHYSTIAEAGNDAPFAELADASGAPLGPAGGRRGQVTGSWFHAIARAA